MPIERKALAEMRRRQQAGLVAVAVAMTGHAKQLATRHTDNGTRRNSVTHTRQTREVLWGIPVRSAPHAVFLELGFKPHWVPMRYMALWARRHGVGQVMTTRARTGRGRSQALKTYKRSRGSALGVFVGGPNSKLQHGPGGLSMQQFRGRQRVRVSYATRGGRSPFLPPGTVGHPILQPTARWIRGQWLPYFKRGFERG